MLKGQLVSSKLIKSLFLVIISIVIFGFSKTQAREVDQITDWYIKSFDSEITVNKDSSLDISEKITADCGNLPDKHGIFRVLPTGYHPTDNEFISTPIELISITDFNGNAYHYQTINDRSNKTVTWKIGDVNKTVTGVSNYQIKYHVKNNIRFGSSDVDELYWNLNGNFWDIETDAFYGIINFPKEINKETYKELWSYAGDFGSKDSETIASSEWIGDNQLAVRSARTLKPGEGITISLTFPKNIISPYVPTFWEQNGQYFYLLIPLLALILSFLLWSKYGRDPKINPTVVPEFEIPDKLPPMEMGMIYSDGILKTDYISAALINLAVKKFIKIEEVTEGKIFKHKDYKLIRLTDSTTALSESEISLLDGVFAGKTEILMSELKNQFYKEIPVLSQQIKNKFVGKGLLIASSRTWQYIFWGLAVLCLALTGGFAISTYLGLGLIISAVTFIIFSFLMTRRSPLGAELFKRIEGFKLYMNTAEKYRERFNEKENIFEKFLPYAIMFGMTKLWISKMKELYGQKYFDSYHPVWFYGAGFLSFNANSFNSAISSVSSSMSSTLSSSPSSSGSGGGGFSGGGGGGGGGGGW